MKEARREINRDAPHIVVEPTTPAIGGVCEVERNRFFAVRDQCAGFDKRMPNEIYDYLVNDLGIAFGRSVGSVKYTASTLPEDPNRPGCADTSSLKASKIGGPA